MKRLITCVGLSVLLLSAFAPASAGPISVSYVVAGSPGSFDLSFHVSNNMMAWPTQNIYFFSVRLSVDAITGSPTNFMDNHPMDANWFNAGGSATDYNNTWVDSPLNNDFLPGQSFSGFTVHIPDLIPPSSVAWSALANSNGAIHPYTGGDNFNTNSNPGFEGLAIPAVIPEPSTFTIAIIGLGSFWRSRQRQRHG